MSHPVVLGPGEGPPPSTPLPASPPPPRFDFPTWVPAMLVKELRQGLRTRGFVGGLIGVQALMLIVFLWGFAADAAGGDWLRVSEGFFWTLVGAILLASPPIRALGALGPEIELRTMDLLLLTRLDAWRIVSGKWISLQVQTLLLLTTLLPYAVVRYFFGSVDLVANFTVIGILFCSGSFLSAAGIWASGFPKLLRVLAVVFTVIVMLQMLGAGLATSMMGGGAFSTGGGSGSDGWELVTLILWSGAVILIYFLVLAVRWFAPPAENHSIVPRLVPLFLAVPALLWAALGHSELVIAQLTIAAVGLTAVAVFEAGSAREVMANHLRGWMARGRAQALLGMLLLPGWPSAALWLAGVLGLAGVVWWGLDQVMAVFLEPAVGVQLLALGWAGLVFPCLLVALMPSARKSAGAVYFAVQALLGIFAAIAGSDDLARVAPAFMGLLDWVSHAMPVSSFWRALSGLDRPSTLAGIEIGQIVGVAATAILLAVQGRPYWARVRMLRETAQAGE
jgi:hypothetical protein